MPPTETRSDSPWDVPAWRFVHQAHSEQTGLVAVLQVLRAACSVAAASVETAEGFRPARGWVSADGLLAQLELHHGTPTVDEITLDPPPTRDLARRCIDQLLRHAAELALAAWTATDHTTHAEDHQLLAEILDELATGYRLIFGRSW